MLSNISVSYMKAMQVHLIKCSCKELKKKNQNVEMDFFGNKQKQKNIKERASSVKKNAYVDRGTSEFVNGSLKSCKNVGEKKHVLGKFSRKKNIENECLHLCNIFTGNLSSFAKVIFFKNLFFLLKYSGILQNYKRKKTKTSLKTPHNHRNIFI